MNRFINYLFTLALMTVTTTGLIAGSHDSSDLHHKQSVIVKGGGTYFYPNPLSNGFGENVTKINLKAKGNRIIKGSVFISSTKAVPFSPVTGTNFEAVGIIDAVRVFPTHPNIVWIHGRQVSGFVTLGTALAPPNGSTSLYNPENGEFIGAITIWGRTNILSVLENNNQPLPNFFTSTEGELTEAVGGFSRILLTNGAKPGKMIIKTKGKDILIP
jgi:hypothetical protein